MYRLSVTPLPGRLFAITAFLHFSGAVLVFVLVAFFTAVHSELGQAISQGEGPVFEWIRRHMTTLLGSGLFYLVFTFLLQRFIYRSGQIPCSPGIRILAGIEFWTIPILAMGLFFDWHVALSLTSIVLLIAIMLQGVLVLHHDEHSLPESVLHLLQKNENRAGLFLFLLFLTGGMLAFFDPSWHRMQDYIRLDTEVDYFLKHSLPPILSGVIAMWFGIFTLTILAGTSAFQIRIYGGARTGKIALYLPFLLLSGFYAAMLLGTLGHAIHWEISELNLSLAMFALFFLIWIGGSILISLSFLKIAMFAPDGGRKSPAALLALSMGAIWLLPVLGFFTPPGTGRWRWRFIIIATLILSGAICYGVLYGDIFDPWFTAFSYLKGAILKTSAIVVSGALVLLIEEILPYGSTKALKDRRPWIIMASAFILGFFPFGILTKYPETKTAILQFNELSRVDTTYARELVHLLKLDRWISIGQRPVQNNNPHPWPHPWKLKKTHQSVLPDNFNLLIIIVDALRGDAFHSAGYRRNLTPFLDFWAMDEAVSFRRAYSQGGGSFSAIPFLVAGRSRFKLYGHDLYRENLYFNMARAEGIQHYMVMKGFGPRAVFPPDFPVLELEIPRSVNDQRSATADEVFNSARTAIGRLPKKERFLCFLHLMDVHNNLWKKAGGIDFGDDPRDLYDNNLSYVDRAFSRFVDWLKQEHIYNQTVILFTSDHGEQFWEHGASLHGHTLYEEEIRIPLILLVHGIQKRFDDIAVIAADMAPTLADLAGYSVAPPYDDPHMGISLVPLILRDERGPYLKRDVVGRASFKRRFFFYRNWEWKLVYFAGLDLFQLFNVIQDPMERNNLIQEEPGLAREMGKELFDYLAKVEGVNYFNPFKD